MRMFQTVKGAIDYPFHLQQHRMNGVQPQPRPLRFLFYINTTQLHQRIVKDRYFFFVGSTRPHTHTVYRVARLVPPFSLSLFLGDDGEVTIALNSLLERLAVRLGVRLRGPLFADVVDERADDVTLGATRVVEPRDGGIAVLLPRARLGVAVVRHLRPLKQNVAPQHQNLRLEAESLVVGVQVDKLKAKRLTGMCFQEVQAVKSQALSTRGQADVNLHHLTSFPSPAADAPSPSFAAATT